MRARFLLMLGAFAVCAQPVFGQWIPNGLAVSADSSDQEYPAIISDDAGGAIVMWLDFRNWPPCIYAQRLDPDGFRLWTSVGIAVGDTSSSLGVGFSDLMPDGSGGAIIAWTTSECIKCDNIYAERINKAGQSLWARSGIPVCTASGQQVNAQIASDGAGGAIIAWEDGRVSSTQTTYAQRLNAAGARLWTTNGIVVCGSTSLQRMQQIVSDGAGGAIITWADRRSGYWDIYAQRVSPSGALLWDSTGLPVCTASNNQTFPQIISDGAQGAIIAWNDSRGNSMDIYALRIGGNGVPLWTPDGLAVCSATNAQTDARLISDEAGGAVLAWSDARGGVYDIYAQRVSAEGVALWTADGVALCTAPQPQDFVQITTDLAGGAIISWQDYRTGDYDVYVQRIDADGTVRWATDGTPVCVKADYQQFPYVASDGAGGGIITWMDYREYSYYVCAQRVRGDGGVIATLLRNFFAQSTNEGIEIEWTLSQEGADVRFLVLRADSRNGKFRELPEPVIERMGMAFRVLDATVGPGRTYAYRIDVDDENGRRSLFVTDPIETPAMPVALYQNVPNPFNPMTVITYYLPERCAAHLDIYDVRGNLVRRLASGVFEEGTHSSQWDGRSGNGQMVSSGIYFCRLEADKGMISRKMILLR